LTTIYNTTHNISQFSTLLFHDLSREHERAKPLKKLILLKGNMTSRTTASLEK